MYQPENLINQVKPSLLILAGLVFLIQNYKGQSCITYFDELLLQYDSIQVEMDNSARINYLDSLLYISQYNNKCPISESDIYRRLGIAYYLNDLDVLAINNFISSVEKAKEINYTEGIASGYLNLASLNYRRKNWPEAYDNYERAYYLFKEMGYWIGEFDSYQYMASCLTAQDSLDRARKMSFKIISMIKEKGYDLIYPHKSYYTLSQIHKIEQNCDSALYYHRLSIGYLEDVKDYEDLHRSNRNMAECYESLGDFDLAIDYYNQALDHAKSLNRKDYITELSDKIIFINGLLQDKNTLVTRNNYLLIVLALFLLTTAVSTYLFWKNRVAAKAQEASKLMKERELNAIEAMLKGQDQERRRIAEELHDRLGGLLSTIKLHFNQISGTHEANESSAESITLTSDLLDEASKEVRRISHDLHSGVLVKFGLKPALEELAITLKNVQKPIFHFYFNDVDKRYSSDIEINCFRIVQECISNILKHSDASDVTLQVSRLNGFLKIMVEDDGKGFDPQKKKKGIGLNNIAKRVGRFNGHLTIDSTPGRGTTIIVDLPIE